MLAAWHRARQAALTLVLSGCAAWGAAALAALLQAGPEIEAIAFLATGILNFLLLDRPIEDHFRR